MTLGPAPRQGDLLDDVVRFCEATLDQRSIYVFLHRERDRLFPDEAFADLFVERGRRSVPPSVVAVVMVLQRLEGLSDREAVERFCFDNRWRYATGSGGYDTGSWTSFSHTVLVDMRERLRRSERPNRIFEVALGAAREAGIVSRRRVLDSTPLYDAVATMDTITLIRSAIRGLLAVADATLAAELRAVMTSGDDYASSAKPQIDWDDAPAASSSSTAGPRTAMRVWRCSTIAAWVRSSPRRRACSPRWSARTRGGRRRQLPDRPPRGQGSVISTVDPDARHGHKTAARGFDGYKGHVAIDPETELITATRVTAGNAGDAGVAAELIADVMTATEAAEAAVVYGDSAYGTGTFQDRLEEAGITSRCKTQPPVSRQGRFAKDRFTVDLENQQVTCPAGVTAVISRRQDGSGSAKFVRPVASARSGCSAPTPRRGAPSRSARRRPPSPVLVVVRSIRRGEQTTGRPVPRWSASSPPGTSPARWAPSPGARPSQGGRRLQPARCRGEPRPAGRAGSLLHPHRGLEPGLSRHHLRLA